MKLKYFINMENEINTNITFFDAVTNVTNANVMELIHLNDHT